MTDRELVEAAAKAAGFRITWGEKYRVGDDEVDCTDLPYVLSDGDEPPAYWNPLTDDGDALRLAVKLHIEFVVDSFDARVTYMPPGQHPMAEGFAEIYEDARADPYAATRRAIVRAAAECG